MNNGKTVKFHLFFLYITLLIFMISSGCIDPNHNKQNSGAPVPHNTVNPPYSVIPSTKQQNENVVVVKTVDPVRSYNITDGFWCRDTTLNIRKANTRVRECYQFFRDGSYLWGYSPGWPLGKSASCSGSADAKCRYTINSRNQVEVEGGYSYSLRENQLIDPHDPPYFIWSSVGIP